MNLVSFYQMSNTNKDNNNFTPLVGVKWTKQRMLKVHDMMWTNYLNKIIDIKLSYEEKYRRLNDMSTWIYHIRNLCNNNDIAFKKNDKRKKK